MTPMAESAGGREGVPINYPDWTDYRKKNGLDPLGMQNSSVNLYQTFLPGISNVTLRMRYYGLYAWLCDRYLKKIGDTDPESWKRVIRRAEALYALLACYSGNERGVAGIEWAQKAVDAATGDTVEFAEAAEPGSESYYLKQAWGAYGAAYRSQLYEIGICDRTSFDQIPIPTEKIGEQLAKAFEEAASKQAALFFDVIQRGSVTKTELDEMTALVPSEIGQTSGERTQYQELLLKLGDPPDPEALSRRRSVLLILKIAELLGREPRPEEVRWILYAGHDPQGRELQTGSPELDGQRELWWIYHANDLCHIALECLLKFTLDNLGNYPRGITLARLIPLCVDRLLEAADETPANWSVFRESVRLSGNAYAPSDGASESNLCDDIIREAGRSDAQICPPETAWKAIVLLAILDKRLREESHDIDSVLGVFDPDAFRSLLTETRFLNQHENEGFAQLLERLIEERVVRRHLWVALRKFRQGDYTFLIEMDDGRLRLREKDGPVFTNPRLGPAITFLKDIYLIGGQGLTDYGVEAASGA